MVESGKEKAKTNILFQKTYAKSSAAIKELGTADGKNKLQRKILNHLSM